MRRHFQRPSASTVIASVALVAALGGTSYAAATITSGNIKNNTIKSIDVKNSSLRGIDVKNSSLTGADVRNESLLAKDFKKGELPAGPPGPQGPAGSNAFGTLTYVATEDVVVASGDEGIASAFCPAGLIPTGGGAFSSNAPNAPDADPPAAVDYAINSSYPFQDVDGAFGWDVFIENNSPDEQTVSAYVICAAAKPAGFFALQRRR
ncbi:MAG: hypothetical protein ACRDKY_11685 [Solirubrobacteraceae bacterium]